MTKKGGRRMEDKILQELKEIKEMLHIVASNTEQKENEISLVVSNIESKSKVAITKELNQTR